MDQSARYDLFSPKTKFVRAHSCELIRKNLQSEIPKIYHGEIFGRLGLSLKFGLTIHNGVIDSDFRGVVCIVVFNHSIEY